MKSEETRSAQADGFTWTRRHTLTLAVLCSAQALDSIDVTVVNVALPAIQDDLGFTTADLSWVVNAYMMAFGGFLLLGGRLGDLLGHRRILDGGIALFTGASLIAGCAQHPGMLVGARALQGLAAALIAPMTLAAIASTFPHGGPRNRAIAIWAAATGVSSTLGLPVGGLLASGPGWRWIFFVNIPIGVILLFAARRTLSNDHRVAGPRRGFDVVGALTVTAGTALLAYAVLQIGSDGGRSAHVIGLLGAAAALLAFFAVHEMRFAKAPLVRFSLFRNRSLTAANVIQALRGSAMFAVFYFATLYQQQVLGYSALTAGLVYLPFTAIMVGASVLSPLLVRRWGIALVAGAGALVTAGGLLLFARISPAGDLVADVLLPLTITGLGFAVMTVPVTTAGLSGVPLSSTGVASAVLNVSAQLGGALGLGILSAAAVGHTNDQIRSGTPADAALTSGLSLGFTAAAALMALAAVVAVVVFHRKADTASTPGADESAAANP